MRNTSKAGLATLIAIILGLIGVWWAGGNVKEFVIEQLQKDRFKIIYVSALPLSEEKIKMITREMTHYLEDGLTIIFERKAQLERSKSGKLKQFSSLLNQNL